MNQEQEKSTRRVPLVSAVWEDGVLVETVADDHTGETTFLVSDENGLKRCEELSHHGVEYRPMRGTNNLLRHRAIRLPSDAAPTQSVEELLAGIDRYLRRYISLPEAARDLACGYILLTWVYDAFRELPYLRFRGEYGTGKTRALMVVGSVAYKPFFASGASTVSPIFHTLDTFRGTLIFDEADFRFSDEKAELVKILNNGNAVGFPVLRTRVTERREFDPQAFVVFGPKIVGMRNRYEDRALESRFLSIDMAPGQGAGVPINLPDEHEAEARALRNSLLRYRFETRLKTALDPALADPHLESRTNQILLPLLSVVPEGRMRTSIRHFAATREAETLSDRGFSIEAEVLKVLHGMSPDRLSLRDFAAAFSAAYGAERERAVSSRYIGTILRRLGLSLYKSDGIHVLAPGQQEKLRALYARYGVHSEGTASGSAVPGS